MLKIPVKNYDLFEKNLSIIDTEINKRQAKWSLTAIPSLSFDDIAQTLRLHIYKKIHLYDKNKSEFKCWINAVITHQLKNILKSLYLNYNKPCLSCACAQGEDDCQIYKKQDITCPLVAYWQKSKLPAYNTKLPLPIDNHQQEVYDLPQKNIDFESTVQNLHEKMEKVLNENERFVYESLYVNHLSDEEVIIKMGYSKNQDTGHVAISKIKKSILAKATQVVYSEEVDIVEN